MVSPAQWPRLAGLFAATGTHRLAGYTFMESADFDFSGILVRLRSDFPSGLRFIVEVLHENVYGAFPAHPFTKGDIFFDIGANVGLVTLQKCREAPDLKVHSFEPHPLTFGLLRENLTLNQLADRVVAENVALSDRQGLIAMVASGRANMAIAVSGAAAQHSQIKDIPCLALDAYCEERGCWPTHLKIDVEGHETEVLLGAAKALDSTREVIMETHSPELLARCRELLLAHQFRILDTPNLLHGIK